jgi:hypothetical protein
MLRDFKPIGHDSPPMVADVIGGQLDFTFESAAIVPLSKGGRFKLLAVSSAKRLPGNPRRALLGRTRHHRVRRPILVRPGGGEGNVTGRHRSSGRRAEQGALGRHSRRRTREIGHDTRAPSPADLRRFLEHELALWGRPCEVAMPRPNNPDLE